MSCPTKSCLSSQWLLLGVGLSCLAACPAPTSSTCAPSGDGHDAGTDAGVKVVIPGDAGVIVTLVSSDNLTPGAVISDMALDETHLYFAERIGLGSPSVAWRKPLAGGAIERLGDTGGSALAITLSATELILCRADAIVAMAKAGGPLRTIATTGKSCTRRGGMGGAPPELLLVDGQLYWVENYEKLMRVAVAGGAPQDVAAADQQPTGIFGLTASPSGLVVSSFSKIDRIGFDGIARTLVTMTSTPTLQLTLVGDTLFYVNYTDSSLTTVPVSGGEATVASFTPKGISAFAIEGETYWLVSPDGVYRAAEGQLPRRISGYPPLLGQYPSEIVVRPDAIFVLAESGIAALLRSR